MALAQRGDVVPVGTHPGGAGRRLTLVPARDGDHIVAGRQRGIHDGAAEEPGGPENDDAHAPQDDVWTLPLSNRHTGASRLADSPG